MSAEQPTPAQPAPAVTDGQRAYEGMARHAQSDGGPPGRSEGWGNLQPWQHGRWEASAATVAAPLREEIAGLRAELEAVTRERDRVTLANNGLLLATDVAGAGLRRRLGDLASQWEHEANAPRRQPVADLELEGAQVRRVLAAQLREALEAPDGS